MSRIIDNIATEAEAIRLSLDAQQEFYKIRGTRIEPGMVLQYATVPLGKVCKNEATGKFALVDSYDHRGRGEQIAEVANHSRTRAAVKTKMASHKEYTETMADVWEPRRLPGPDMDTPGTTYTRGEERLALARVPLDTPDHQKKRVLYEKVAEVLAEGLA